jgi:uncharacterized protein (DUF58 family)
MVTRGLLLALGTTTALYLMARTTGSGWVMVLFSALAATIVVSAVWSLLVLRSTALGVAAPGDAVVGEPYRMTVRTLSNATADVRVRLRPQAPHDPRTIPDPVALSAAPSVELEAIATRRGVQRRAEFELSVGAPLGLVWWRRRDRLTVDPPTFVGPRPLVTSGGASRARSLHANRHGSPSDLVRGTRAYRPGDPMRSLHWPATARTGSRVVKELDREDRPTLLFVVDLTGPDGERIACEVAAETIAALESGAAIRMVTMEAGGQVDGNVASRREIGRRLAGAVTSAAPVDP